MTKKERAKLVTIVGRFPEFEGCMGIGMGAGEKPVIHVYGKTKKCLKAVPDVFEGYPVLKRVVGRIRPLRAGF